MAKNPFLQDTPIKEKRKADRSITPDSEKSETNPFLQDGSSAVKKEEKERENIKRVTLPDFLGGGQFFKGEGEELITTPRDVPQDLKDELRGGGFYETDKEVDHIIPKSLGGTDSPENLQTLESEESLMGEIRGLFGAEPETPGERPKEERQEGKMVREWEALEEYKEGEISLPQARLQVMKFQQKPKDVSDFFWDSFKEIPGDFVNGVKDIFVENDSSPEKKEKKPQKATQKPQKTTEEVAKTEKKRQKETNPFLKTTEGKDRKTMNRDTAEALLNFANRMNRIMNRTTEAALMGQKAIQKEREKEKEEFMESLKFQNLDEKDINKMAEEKAGEVVKTYGKPETFGTTPERGETNLPTKLIKDIAQYTIRDHLIYSQKLFPQIEFDERSGKVDLKEQYEPKSELASILTGMKKEGEETSLKETERDKKKKASLETIGHEWVGEDAPTWLALAVGNAQMGLDLLTPGISGSAVRRGSKNIAKTADLSKITDELLNIFKTEKRTDLEPMARTLKDETDPKNIEKFLNDTIRSHKKAKIKNAKRTVRDQEELLQSAKRYTNEDEFIKANKGKANKGELQTIFRQAKVSDDIKKLPGKVATEGEDFFMTPTTRKRWSPARREKAFRESVRRNLFKKAEREKAQVLKQRRNKVNAITDYFKIPETEVRKIFKKDLNRMTDSEFNKSFEELKQKAEPLAKEINLKREKLQKIQDIKIKRIDKGIDKNVEDKLRARNNVGRMQDADMETLNKIEKKIDELEPGDQLLTDKQVKALEPFIGDDAYKTVRELSEKYNIDVVKTNTLSRFSPIIRKSEQNELLGKIIDHTKNNMQFSRINKKTIFNNFDKKYKKAIKSQRGMGKKKKVWDNVFRHMSGEDVKLTENEQELADFMRNYFDDAKEYLLNRGDMNLPRKDYIPHISKDMSELISDHGFFTGLRKWTKQKFNMPEDQLPVNIWQNLEYIIGDSKYFKHVQQRKGGIEPTKDLEKIFKGYAGMFETKKGLDDSLPSLQAAAKVLSEPKTAKWLTDYAQQVKGRGFDFKVKNAMSEASWVADRIVDLNYLAFLGFRPISAAMNNIGGNVMTFSFMPIHRYLWGKKRLAANPKRAYDIITKNGFLDGDYVEYASGGAPNLINQSAFALQKMAEYEVRGSAILGQLTRKEFKTGQISGKRITEIMDFLEDTQGVFTAERSPMAAKTFWGRQMLQFARWMITDTSKLKETIKAGAKDIRKGKVASKNVRSMTKLLMAHMAGGYLAAEFSKSGDENAEKMARALQEPTNVSVRVIDAELPATMVADNPVMQQIRNFRNDLEMINYKLGVRRYPFKFQQKEGVADSYVGLINTLQDQGVLEPESASQWHTYLKSLPKEEANEKFQKIKKEEPKKAARIKKYAEWDKLELTTHERNFARMGVENKERAKTVDEYIKDLPKEKRNDKFRQLKKAGIITDKVEEQIKQMQ